MNKYFLLDTFLSICILCGLQYLYAGEHMDLKAIMNTWTLQRGIPLVRVKQQGSKLYFKQERFIKTTLPGDPLWASLQKG